VAARRLLRHFRFHHHARPTLLVFTIDSGAAAGFHDSPTPNSLSHATSDTRYAGFTWGGESDLTAGRILSPEGQGGPGRIDEAEQFLRDLLSDGPVCQADVEKQARANGVSLSTLKRAKKGMNVKSRKNGKTGEWMWALPAASDS
jgi:hypothetical protein